MQICGQADTSAFHTPRTMCVCVPVSSAAKSIDGTASHVCNIFLRLGSHQPV